MAKKLKTFKLDEETILELDVIAAWMETDRGGTPTRTDAMRTATRKMFQSIPEEERKKILKKLSKRY